MFNSEKILYLESIKQLYRLSKLYKKDYKLFREVANYYPFSITINDINTLDISFANPTISKWMEFDKSEIEDKGFPLIKSISDINFLSHALKTVRYFEKNKIIDSNCSYFQRVKLSGKMDYLLSYKTFLDETNYITMGYKLSLFESVDNSASKALDEFNEENGLFLRYFSISKREKEILKLLSLGMSNKQISDILFISPNTIRTHRNSINRKLDIKNFRDIIKVSKAFELFNTYDNLFKFPPIL